MSGLKRVSVRDNARILNDLKYRKIQHFNKEYQKLLLLIEEYHFLEDFKEELETLKKNYTEELEKIKIDDVRRDRHDSIANSAESKYMQKLFELKSKIISYKDRYINIITKYEVKDSIKYIEEYLENEEKVLKITLDMIKSLDETEYKRIEKLDNPLDLKLKEAKVIYLKLLNTRLIKEELRDVFDDLDFNEQIFAQKLLDKKYIDKKVYRNFMHEYYMNQQSEELSKIQESFEKLGYTFEEDIKDNSLQYINTSEDEYKIAIRVENGKVTLVFTRLIPKGVTLTEYEKAKDVEKANKWCGDYDKIKKVMEENGLFVNEEMRIDASVENIRYEEADEVPESIGIGEESTMERNAKGNGL